MLFVTRNSLHYTTYYLVWYQKSNNVILKCFQYKNNLYLRKTINYTNGDDKFTTEWVIYSTFTYNHSINILIFLWKVSATKVILSPLLQPDVGFWVPQFFRMSFFFGGMEHVRLDRGGGGFFLSWAGRDAWKVKPPVTGCEPDCAFRHSCLILYTV